MPRILRVITFVALLALVGTACGNDDDDANGAAAGPTTATTDKTSPSEGGNGRGDKHAITIKLIAFKPAEITVPAGTAVTWLQDDVATHTITSGQVERSGGTVTAKPDGKFDSGNISKGENFEFTFLQAGSFPFFCAIHPATMTGVVQVT